MRAAQARVVVDLTSDTGELQRVDTGGAARARDVAAFDAVKSCCPLGRVRGRISLHVVGLT